MVILNGLFCGVYWLLLLLFNYWVCFYTTSLHNCYYFFNVTFALLFDFKNKNCFWELFVFLLNKWRLRITILCFLIWGKWWQYIGNKKERKKKPISKVHFFASIHFTFWYILFLKLKCVVFKNRSHILQYIRLF